MTTRTGDSSELIYFETHQECAECLCALFAQCERYKYFCEAVLRSRGWGWDDTRPGVSPQPHRAHLARAPGSGCHLSWHFPANWRQPDQPQISNTRTTWATMLLYYLEYSPPSLEVLLLHISSLCVCWYQCEFYILLCSVHGCCKFLSRQKAVIWLTLGRRNIASHRTCGHGDWKMLSIGGWHHLALTLSLDLITLLCSKALAKQQKSLIKYVLLIKLESEWIRGDKTAQQLADKNIYKLCR